MEPQKLKEKEEKKKKGLPNLRRTGPPPSEWTPHHERSPLPRASVAPVSGVAATTRAPPKRRSPGPALAIFVPASLLFPVGVGCPAGRRGAVSIFFFPGLQPLLLPLLANFFLLVLQLLEPPLSLLLPLAALQHLLHHLVVEFKKK